MLPIIDTFDDKLVVKCPCGIEFTTTTEKYTPKLRCSLCTANLKKKSKGKRPKSDAPLEQLYEVFYNLHSKLIEEREE
jgi:acetone carboxylase gamma subunit